MSEDEHRKHLRQKAEKFPTRTALWKDSPATYMACLRSGVLDTVFRASGRSGYSDDEIISSALNYTTKRDWELSERGMYRAALKRGEDFFAGVTAHMAKKNHVEDKEIKKVAKVMKDAVEFARVAASTYAIAKRRGILDELEYEK